MFTISLAHLLARGVRLQPHEAVAIAQALIERGSGVAAPERIYLASDGSLSGLGPASTVEVADIANLLQVLLPPTQSQVPAPLRYAIARGLRAVDAPPYESPDAFSRALARFEAGERREAVRGLLQRVARSRSAAAAPVVERPAPLAPPIPVAPPVVHAAEPIRVASPAAPAAEPMRLASPAVHAAEPVRSPAAGAAAAPSRARFHSAVLVVFVLLLSALLGAAVSKLRDRRDTPQVQEAESPAADTPSRVPAERAVSPTVQESGKPVSVPAAPAVPAAEPRAVSSDSTATAAERRGERSGGVPAPALDPGAPRSASLPQPPSEQAARRAPASPAPPVPVGSAGTASPPMDSTGTAVFGMTASPGSPAGDLGIMTIADDNGRNYDARPSPDGRLVAFDSDRDGERAVYVAERDGSHVRRISGDGFAAAPTWSPDSKRLAYLRAEPGAPAARNLWVQGVEGGEAAPLTRYRSGQTGAASWFPDNRRIGYTHDDKVIVLDVATGETQPFDSPVKGRALRAAAVSPDGTKVIFEVANQGAWLLDLADGSMQCALADPTAGQFAWAPDGRRVAFHSKRDGRWGVYVLSKG